MIDMAEDDVTSPACARAAFVEVASDGARRTAERWIAEEMPIGIEVNGIGYAVLMATPVDLADLAIGFALSDRLVESRADVRDIDIFRRDDDVVVRFTLVPEAAARVHARVRHRATDSSCGLCGIDNLDAVARALPRVTAHTRADDAAVFAALATLGEAQSLGRRTRAAHAAAWCDAAGGIVAIREDIGRHNALDKLIGAMAVAGSDWDGGFALLTSRCSFELVEKAVLANCPLLVTISAPTGLALRRARAAGLRLKVLARPDALLDVGGDA